MPPDILFPGVFVDELPAAARAIDGVPTAITAFVGRTARGVEQASLVTSVAAFERQFGQVAPTFPVGDALRDFFANGGTQALVLRLFTPTAGRVDTARLRCGQLELVASSRGGWANGLRMRIDGQVSAALAANVGLPTDALFNLTVHDGASGTTEIFADVTLQNSPRRLDRVLASGSALVRVASALPEALVPLVPLAPPAHAAMPAAGRTIWTDDATSTGVAAADRTADSARLLARDYLGRRAAGTGLHALRGADPFNLLCIPPDRRQGDTPLSVYRAALGLCVERRAMLIVDAPAAWTAVADLVVPDSTAVARLGLTGTSARNAALFFPRLLKAGAGDGRAQAVAPCGAVAGLMARNDATRGVWKAAAGTTIALAGAPQPALQLSDGEIAQVAKLGVNALRALPGGSTVIWGARTLRGTDAQPDDFKYIPVRRTALYIEDSLVRGLRWVAFEPNGQALWAAVRLAVGRFLQGLFSQGAFQGSTPGQAWFVRCDDSTMTPGDIDAGVIKLLVGFAPLKPAEFVVLDIRLDAAPTGG